MMDELLTMTLLILGVVGFEFLNLKGIGVMGDSRSIAAYAIKTLPIQLIAYFIFVSGLNLGFKTFSNDIWFLMLVQIITSYLVKIFMRLVMFGQYPAKGTLLGLVLVIMATFVSKFWK